MATITKQFRFEASHRLVNHKGKCANPHGHSYVAVVEVEGEIKPASGNSDEGMVIDYGDLSDAWNALEPLLDHRDLNESIGPECGPTTAENIARWLLRRFQLAIPRRSSEAGLDRRVTAVTVHETANTSATVRE